MGVNHKRYKRAAPTFGKIKVFRSFASFTLTHSFTMEKVLVGWGRGIDTRDVEDDSLVRALPIGGFIYAFKDGSRGVRWGSLGMVHIGFIVSIILRSFIEVHRPQRTGYERLTNGAYERLKNGVFERLMNALRTGSMDLMNLMQCQNNQRKLLRAH